VSAEASLLQVLLVTLDFLGVAVFAASGALKAAEKNMDIFGFVLVAAVTGIGGGTLRDLLLGVRPVFWVSRAEYLILCLTAACLTFVLARQLKERERWLAWADAVGLATFCVVGAELARSEGAPMLVAVLMGIMTAVFGGIARDVLCGEIPSILRREIYATAAAAGSLVYLAASELTGSRELGVVLGFVVALTARALVIIYGLSLPTYRPRR
jgi:uncharacterized membrane protein YeiH